MTAQAGYRGRFAPSPTGPLHAGSLVAALASWLDARAHGGQWLVRIEDLDQPRCVAGTDQRILQQLAACSLHPDTTPQWQSRRHAHYQQALAQLQAQHAVYPCACSRRELAQTAAANGDARSAHVRHAELVYPGTCRDGLRGRAARAWRFRTEKDLLTRWHDRRLGPQQQDVGREVGDFVVLRADGIFAYQLGVVVDDALQGVTHVVRGADLCDNTARQLLLQQALGYPTPRYLHTPLVHGANGEKLSKQNGARPLDTTSPQAAWQELQRAAATLGLQAAASGDNTASALATWVAEWRATVAE